MPRLRSALMPASLMSLDSAQARDNATDDGTGWRGVLRMAIWDVRLFFPEQSLA
jgi:hypothetical protein